MKQKKEILFFQAVLLLLSGCAVYQSVQEPVLRVLRRGSCIAVDIPPITLTPQRTAAERQLMGEEAEIEPDGWLIASAQSSAYAVQSSQFSTEAQEVRRFYIEQGTLDFYEDAIRYYKSIGLLGESHDGRILLVPLRYLRQETKESYLSERSTAALVAKEVNAARQWLNNYQEQKNGKALADRPYQSAKAGEWRLEPGGRWKQVK